MLAPMETTANSDVEVDLRRVRVRLIEPSERVRWDALMRAHHYLGLRALVGRSLRYVAECDGRWLALLGWASAALMCAPRDRWIGWAREVQWQRLPLIANNSRFLLLPGVRVKNLASRILGLNAARLSADWARVHGHGLVLAETFVDPGRFRGTCYRAANWRELGATRGFARSNRRYVAHGRAKHVWVLPLRPDTQALLAAPLPDPRLPRLKVRMMRLSEASATELFERLDQIEDTRKPRGCRHSQHTLLAMAICAVVCGAQGPTAIAEWVQRLSEPMLRRLHCRRRPDGSYARPSEPTLRRLAQRVDIDQLEAALGEWLRGQWTPDEAIAIDGKTLRGSTDGGRGRHLVAAVGHTSQVVGAQVEVDSKHNEIPALRDMLEPVPIEGRVVTADAMHTQTETARFLVEDKQADYLFTAKDNQPTLKDDIASLHLEAFPP
jgi:hypothetical protein